MNIRIKQLANSGQILFRDIDLAVLWRISNKNTLYTTIKRYTRSGSIERIGSGLAAQAGMIGPVSTLLMSIFILDEPLTVWVAAGTALVLLGIYVFSRGMGPALAQAAS